MLFMGTDAEPEEPSEVKRTRKNLFMSGKLYSDTFSHNAPQTLTR